MSRGPLSAIGKFALTLSISGIGGWTMWYLQMPLAWLLGAMIFCSVAAFVGLPLAMPKFSRPPMTATIGAMLGTSFAPNVFDHLRVWMVSVCGLVFFIAAAATVAYVYFRKVGRFDHPTAFFSAMPGGLVEMVTLGGERGGEERMISLIHASRIFLVVLCLPFVIQVITGQELSRNGSGLVPVSAVEASDLLWFLASIVVGVSLGVILRMPARFLLGPMIVSAGIHLSGVSDFLLPSVLLAAAQIVIGATVGCRFVNTPPLLILRVLGLSAGSTALLLGISLAFALSVSSITGDRFVGSVLAYSPGGVAEMSLIALSLGIEVPFVVFHHIIRVLLVVAGSAAVFRPSPRPLQR